MAWSSWRIGMCLLAFAFFIWVDVDCDAQTAEGGAPSQPQWVSMFSGSNALNGQVNALLVHDFGDGPALYVGGNFTMAGNQVVNRIAKWNLTGSGGWSPLGGGISSFGGVTCLAVFDDGVNGPALHAGGTFAGVVKKWNGSQWQTIANGSIQPEAYSMTVYDDGSGPDLYIGGAFLFQDQVHTLLRWDGEKVSPTGVSEGGKIGAVSNNTVFDDGSGAAMYISGNFYVPPSLSSFAKGNGSDWQSLWQFNAGLVGPLMAFDEGSGPSLYAGCRLFQGGSLLATGVAKWDGRTWAQLGTGFDGSCGFASCVNYCGQQAPGGCYCDFACCSFGDCCFDVHSICGHCGFDGPSTCHIDALAVFDDGAGAGPALYAAGAFGSIGGIEVNNIAQWKGQAWHSVAEGISTVNIHGISVLVLAAYQPTNGDPPILFAGGNFTTTTVGDKYLVAYVGCPTPQCAAADINCDGIVNVGDLLTVINAWGSCPPPPQTCATDIAPPPNGDGQINVLDLLLIINNWG